MRCLVVADLHYSLPQFDWLLAAADEFDLVIFAGDTLDIGSMVDFRAQILVVKKYLTLLVERTRVILCSGNHDLDERSAEGEKISRWVGDVRELGVACDGDSLAIGDTLFTVCPWWDGPLVKARLDMQLREAAACRLNDWVWVHHAPPANSPTSWGGKAVFRRRRTGAMDRAASAVDGDLGPCAPVALHPRWLVVRSSRFDLGVQHRAAARTSADLHRARYGRWQGVLARGRRRAGHRSEGAAAAAGRTGRTSADVAYILGSDCRSDPGETCIGGKLIMLCRSSPTIERWLPWSAYWCMMSAR